MSKSLAEALKKAGAISDDKLSLHEKNLKEKAKENEKFNNLKAQTLFFKDFLASLEIMSTKFLSEYYQQKYFLLEGFLKTFKDNSEITKSVNFHFNAIVKKQNFKIEYFPFEGLLSEEVKKTWSGSIKSEYTRIWGARATGYALCHAFEHPEKYSKKTKEEILTWLKPIEDKLFSDPLTFFEQRHHNHQKSLSEG